MQYEEYVYDKKVITGKENEKILKFINDVKKKTNFYSSYKAFKNVMYKKPQFKDLEKL